MARTPQPQSAANRSLGDQGEPDPPCAAAADQVFDHAEQALPTVAALGEDRERLSNRLQRKLQPSPRFNPTSGDGGDSRLQALSGPVNAAVAGRDDQRIPGCLGSAQRPPSPLRR